MTPNAETAALLVRVTARISAALVACSLLVAAGRVGRVESATADLIRSAPPTASALRTADIGLFVAFLMSHTIHFGCVVLLAAATGGENIRVRGGWIAMLAVAMLFYGGCLTTLQAKRRPGAWWTSARARRIECTVLAALWLGFFQAYAGRLLQSWLFVVLAIGLLFSAARFFRYVMSGT